MGSEGEEEEDAPKRKGFRDRMDLCLGAMMQLTRERERERERERQLEKYQTYLISKDKNSKVRMHENT